MSPRKARTPETAILPKAKVHLQADISVNGAGYGSWRPDEPGAPPLARRIAILLGHIERVWKDASDEDCEAMSRWLLSLWEPPK